MRVREVKGLNNEQNLESLLLKDEDDQLIFMCGVNRGNTSAANLGNPDFLKTWGQFPAFVQLTA